MNSRNTIWRAAPRFLPGKSLTGKGLLMLCVVLFACHRAEATRRQDVESGSAAGMAGANFAIADFDGDALPDFASVQPGPAMASRTSYWIQFAFSQGDQRSFAVSGPTGGLQIASQDVNGDSFLDLIVSTRISNQPVAVLMNDGRGNFRLADTAAFGAAIWNTQLEWRAEALCYTDTEGALGNSGWAGGICQGGVRAASPLAIATVSAADDAPHLLLFPHEFRGRAPPAA